MNNPIPATGRHSSPTTDPAWMSPGAEPAWPWRKPSCSPGPMTELQQSMEVLG